MHFWIQPFHSRTECSMYVSVTEAVSLVILKFGKLERSYLILIIINESILSLEC